MRGPTGPDLLEYLRVQFRLMASHMHDPGTVTLEWGGHQHRDMVRIFMAGAAMANPDPFLDAFLEAISAPDWRPDSNFQWGPPDVMKAEVEATITAQALNHNRPAGLTPWGPSVGGDQ